MKNQIIMTAEKSFNFSINNFPSDAISYLVSEAIIDLYSIRIVTNINLSDIQKEGAELTRDYAITCIIDQEYNYDSCKESLISWCNDIQLSKLDITKQIDSIMIKFYQAVLATI